MKVENLELEVGREYALATYYGFKTGPYHVVYLGDSHFQGCEREFFRRVRDGDKDRREYFAIKEPTFSAGIFSRVGIFDNVNQRDDKRNGLLIINTKLPNFPEGYFDSEVESEDLPDSDYYEVVFKIDSKGKFLGDSPSDPRPFSESERSKLLKILRELREEV